ncbi:hypothetical protein [Bacillus solitudinis]|uniref:hypothetical protein n=1 Tax=Bacillus solitudinis TaxID=2014074 RepID=UPI000C24157F|nr:hypothetical protein [Bacillus solitudinis]
MIGLIAGISSILLCCNFTIINSYNNPTLAGAMPSPFLLLFLPAALAIFSSLTSNQKLMFTSFLWSLPMSFFMVAMPDIFSLYGLISIFYFVSFLIMRFKSFA